MKPNIPMNNFLASALIVGEKTIPHKFLLLKRAVTTFFGNEWFHIAGEIEQGESASDAIVREIKEETGLKINNLYSADFCEQFYSVNTDCITIVPAFVAFVDENQKIILNEEHTEYKWVTFSEAISIVTFNCQKKLLETVYEGFIIKQPSKWLKIAKYSS